MRITKEELLSALDNQEFTILDANIVKQAGDDFNKEVTYEAWLIDNSNDVCSLGIQEIMYERNTFSFKRFSGEGFQECGLLEALEEDGGHIDELWERMTPKSRKEWSDIVFNGVDREFINDVIYVYELPESSMLYKLCKVKLDARNK